LPLLNEYWLSLNAYSKKACFIRKVVKNARDILLLLVPLQSGILKQTLPEANLMINRKQLITRHNPKLTNFDPHSPLSVGNGEFVFTADVTGLQSFNELYEDAMPLCTMANWGWHSTPYSNKIKALQKIDISPKYYDTYGRQVPYYTNHKDGVDKYNWIRQNPHKYNLGRVGFVFEDETGNILPSFAVTGVNQELDLYTGILHSHFSVNGVACYVKTAVCAESDTIAIEAESALIDNEKMYINIAFPYPSHEKSGCEWFGDEKHKSQLYHIEEGQSSKIERVIDDVRFSVAVKGNDIRVGHRQTHRYFIKTNGKKLNVLISFNSNDVPVNSTQDVFGSSAAKWQAYWENGGMISLEKSTDPRAAKLERRIVLSQYLTAIQCGGSLPPAETGLTCNSWYGKFHLEMHYWHAAHFALFGRIEYLEKSLQWYIGILDEAKKGAAFQGYDGARWPKMVAPSGIDSPSPIGPLLIWQQPHPILYCDWIYKANPKRQTLEQYKDIVEETAKFMVDYAHFDGERYVLGPPVIPAQERHAASTCFNPTYELEYWIYGLKTAVWWLEQLGVAVPEKWLDVIEKLALPTIHNNVYVAQENSLDTFENVNNDHPSMLMAYGVIGSGRIDKNVMNATLDRVLKDWDYPTMWGWDFGVMTMTAVRLGRPEVAIDILLRKTEKNVYVTNGHNRQVTRKDLPLYLPGNGALLLAVAMMAAGYEGCTETTPGFNVPGWAVEFEGIRPYSAEC